MQQENEPQSERSQGGPANWSPSRLSSLAVVAMVLACLPCPPVSLLGAVLGLMALSRIKQSNGSMTGVRLARISIVVGVAMSLISVILLSLFQSHVERGQEEGISKAVHTFVVQSMNNNAAGALAYWDLQGHPITVEQVEDFGQDVAKRFGSFKSLRVGKINPAADMSLLKAGLDAWLIFEFDSGTRNGSGSFLLVPKMGTFTLGVRIRGLNIDDPEGAVSIPPKPEPVNTNATASEPVES
ncbi:MAG: hypothetical protein CMJ40_10775 [Phycisphaerae bacterium]|nr:hypothetical protein [Phycisphaerae bacterium]